MAALSTLVDEFSTGSVPDSGRWPTTYGDSVTVSGGQALISCTTTFAGMASAVTYTFDSITAEVFPPALNGASSDCYGTIMVLSDAEADGTSIGFYINRIDGLIYAVNWVGYSDGSAVSETYSATNHAFLHITYNGSSVVWERSATLTGSRTTIRTLGSPPSWVTASDIGVYFDTHRDSGTNNNYAISAVNPPTAVTGTAAAPLGALAGTAAGTPTTFGTAAAPLGALAGTAAGVPTTFGTAAAPLGALAGTAAGGPTTSGTAASALGALTGVASGTGSTPVPVVAARAERVRVAQKASVELFYDSAWHDLIPADDVFAEPIKIQRGNSDESAAPRPAQVELQLANDDDTYRPANPESPLYGKAGVNTPLRVATDGVVRAHVEASSLSAQQSRDFRRYPKRGRAWVDVEAGGLLQRINQWTELIQSTMIKGMLSFGSDLIGGFPLEDASTSTILSNLIAGGSPGTFTDVTLGDNERPAGSARSVKLGSDGRISGTFLPSTASGWQLSFAFRLPALPGSATAEEIFSWRDSTGRRWAWEVNNANFGWVVYDADGTTVLETLASPYSGSEPNQWVRVKVKTTVSGSTVTYEPSWYIEGRLIDTGTTGTFTGTSTGRLTTWEAVANTYNVDAWYTGVFAIDNSAATIFNAGVIDDFNGHVGETTGARFARLMGDLGLAYTVLGTSADSHPMGGQPEATLADLLNEIQTTEDGLIFDDIDAIGLVFKLRNHRYNQTPKLTLNAASEIHGMPALPPEVTDDLPIHNVVTASQRDGGEFTATDSTSSMGTQAPPNGRGEYRQTRDVNVESEIISLPQQAYWWLRRGTVDLPRYPQVVVNLAVLDEARLAEAEAVDIGDVIEITRYRENTIRLHVLGYTEIIGAARSQRKIAFNCAPDQQFVVGEYDSTATRYGTPTATLAEDLTTTETIWDVTATQIDHLFSTTALPYDVIVGGERCTVTAASAPAGSGPYTQTLTCLRSINDIHKKHSNGDPIRIADPARWAL